MYREFDQHYIRIFNMHSTHAVLFLSDQAKEAFLSSIATYPDCTWMFALREMARSEDAPGEAAVLLAGGWAGRQSGDDELLRRTAIGGTATL